MSTETKKKTKTKEYVSKGKGYEWRHGSNVICITADDDGTFSVYIRVDKGCNYRYTIGGTGKTAEEANEDVESAFAWLANDE